MTKEERYEKRIAFLRELLEAVEDELKLQNQPLNAAAIRVALEFDESHAE